MEEFEFLKDIKIILNEDLVYSYQNSIKDLKLKKCNNSKVLEVNESR